MKRDSLIKSFRETLATDYSLRSAISAELMVHERTIQRWATNNNPKLCTDHFLKALRKHGNIAKSVELIEQVDITLPHEVVA